MDRIFVVEVQLSDTLANVAHKIFAANIQTLRDTQKVLDLDILEKAVETILRASSLSGKTLCG